MGGGAPERLYGGLACFPRRAHPDYDHLMATILDWYRRDECFPRQNTEATPVPGFVPCLENSGRVKRPGSERRATSMWTKRRADSPLTRFVSRVVRKGSIESSRAPFTAAIKGPYLEQPEPGARRVNGG